MRRKHVKKVSRSVIEPLVRFKKGKFLAKIWCHILCSVQSDITIFETFIISATLVMDGETSEFTWSNCRLGDYK